MQKLHELQGEQFDQVYLKFMVQGHEKAIKTLTEAHEKLEDPDIRELVGDLIPILGQHLELAQHLRGDSAPQEPN